MIYFITILLFSFSSYSQEPKEIILNDGSKIVTLIEKSSLHPNCKAERSFIEIQNSPYKSGSSKINSRIRKEMTVGKKLKLTDCPELKSSEDYTYYNSAKVTGQKDLTIGIQSLVVFPGGSGRYVLKCDSYNLKTGKAFNLKSCLKEATFLDLKKRICQSAKKNPDYTEDAQKQVVNDYFCKDALLEAQYCLTNEGIKAIAPWNGNWRIIAEEAELKWSEQNIWGTKNCNLN